MTNDTATNDAAPNNTETDDVEPEEDVTLFKGASNNSYFAVYFNALP